DVEHDLPDAVSAGDRPRRGAPRVDALEHFHHRWPMPCATLERSSQLILNSIRLRHPKPPLLFQRWIPADLRRARLTAGSREPGETSTARRNAVSARAESPSPHHASPVL